MRRPYEDENPMHMIGHDHEPVQEKPREMRREISPAFVCHLAERGKGHPTIHDLTQHTLTAMSADRDEIHARLRVVVARQANRTTTVSFGVVTCMSSFRWGKACLAPTRTVCVLSLPSARSAFPLISPYTRSQRITSPNRRSIASTSSRPAPRSRIWRAAAWARRIRSTSSRKFAARSCDRNPCW